MSTQRAFLNGKEGDVIAFAKGSKVDIVGMLLNQDGSVHDLSTATLDVLVYSRSDRNVNVTATHAATIGTAAKGIFSVAIADADADYGPGRYYAFVRRTLSTDITWSDKPTIFDVK